jgi:hypothetical protein
MAGSILVPDGVATRGGDLCIYGVTVQRPALKRRRSTRVLLYAGGHLMKSL